MSVPVKVSVIIPTYNMGHLVDNAISSVLSGTMRDIEIICADDGSTDDTAYVVEAFTDPARPCYDRRVTYLYHKNQGKAATLNCALRQACGNYVAILDADDALPEDSLALRYAAAMQPGAPPADLVIGSFAILSKGLLLELRRLRAGTSPQELLHRLRFGYKSPFHLNGCLMKRDVIDQVGPFDEQLRRTQDIDYALRLLKHVGEVVCLDSVVYHYRKHERCRQHRIQTRWTVMRARARAQWRNARGPSKLLGTVFGILFDSAKLLYELKDDPRIEITEEVHGTPILTHDLGAEQRQERNLLVPYEQWS